MPIFKFAFSNRLINRDVLTLLYATINNQHLTSNEKDKVKKNLKNFLVNKLGFDLKIIEIDDNKLKEDKLLGLVVKLES